MSRAKVTARSNGRGVRGVAGGEGSVRCGVDGETFAAAGLGGCDGPPRRWGGRARRGRRPSAPRHPPEPTPSRAKEDEEKGGTRAARASRPERVDASGRRERRPPRDRRHRQAREVGTVASLGAVLAEPWRRSGDFPAKIPEPWLLDRQVDVARARACASGKDRTPHLPARRGAHLRALRGVFRGRGQGKHGSHWGSLHRSRASQLPTSPRRSSSTRSFSVALCRLTRASCYGIQPSVTLVRPLRALPGASRAAGAFDKAPAFSDKKVAGRPG